MVSASKICSVIEREIKVNKRVFASKASERRIRRLFEYMEIICAGFCFLGCLKFRCLPILINNRTTCECANRRVPCDENSQDNHQSKKNDCDDESIIQQKRQLTSLKSTAGKMNNDCGGGVRLVFFLFLERLSDRITGMFSLELTFDE